MPAKYQLKMAKNGKTYFNLLAANGEVVLTSQMYASKSAAKNGIRSVRTNAGDPARSEQLQNQSGRHYFVLKAGNHQVIGTSQAYATAAAMDKGLKAVAKAAAAEKVDDAT
jgi:uncharacterized protein YegP (UPF0339 family)